MMVRPFETCWCPWFWREHSWYFPAPPQSDPWLPDSAISIVYLLSNLKRRVFNGHLPLPFPQLLSPDSLPHCHTENLLSEGRVAFVLLLLEWTLEVCKGWGGGFKNKRKRLGERYKRGKSPYREMPYVLLGVSPWERGYLISASIHSQFSQWFEGPFRNWNLQRLMVIRSRASEVPAFLPSAAHSEEIWQMSGSPVMSRNQDTKKHPESKQA